LSGLPELLRRLFRYYGFEGGPAAEGSPLLLRKGGLQVELIPVEGATELDESGLAGLLARGSRADRRIVASLGRFSAGARELAERRKVQLWDRSRLEEEAGRMLLAEVDTREAPDADESLLEPFLSGKTLGEGAPETEASGAAAAKGGSETGDAVCEALPGLELFDGEAAVPPAVTQERARELAAERLEGAFRFDLRTVPHYCFAFVCRVDTRHGRSETKRGLLLVNGLSGAVSAWEPAALVRPDGAAVRVEPALDRAQAEERAGAWVVSANTRVVHRRHDRGGVTVYEKTTLRPSPGALRLGYRGLIFLPVWGIEGGNGAVVLDALEGGIVKEELFAPVARSGADGAAETPGRSE